MLRNHLTRRCLYQGHRPMIVAVAIMGMVKVSVDDIVDVISVGYGFVSTAWTMNMVGIVSAACMSWCAYIGVGFIDIKGVLIDMIPVWVMKMTVMQIIDVIIVDNCGMSTVFIVNMSVVFVF